MFDFDASINEKRDAYGAKNDAEKAVEEDEKAEKDKNAPKKKSAGFDIFAENDMFAEEYSSPSAVMRQASSSAFENPLLTDNWDDAEGYYRYVMSLWVC